MDFINKTCIVSSSSHKYFSKPVEPSFSVSVLSSFTTVHCSLQSPRSFSILVNVRISYHSHYKTSECNSHILCSGTMHKCLCKVCMKYGKMKEKYAASTIHVYVCRPYLLVPIQTVFIV